MAQAKNIMRRAVEEIIDPSPRTADPLWEYFDSQCAYCGKELNRGSRDGHIDHAVPNEGNHLGNLLLACGTCNGDEKREQPWREFLRTKASDAEFEEREARILGWFELHRRAPTVRSTDVVRLQEELYELIERFGVECGELKKIVGDLGSDSKPDSAS